MKEFVPAGRIVNTHGVAGEVKIEVWLDSPEFLKRCGRIFLGEKDYKLVSGRNHKGFLLAKLDGIDDVNAAMTLKGKEIAIRREDAKLKEGEYFIQDILGFAVVDEDGKAVGVLESVEESPASLLYFVKGTDGTEHIIPAVPAFLRGIDGENETITVHMIEGM